MISRYYTTSAGLHLLVLYLLVFSPWSRKGEGPGVMIDGFEFVGGAGEGTTTGPKQKDIGQVVPVPVPVPVPEKPAPVQKAQEAEDAWKVKTKETPKAPPKPTPVPQPIQRGEVKQEEKTNIIRRGVTPDTKPGAGGFDFGETSNAGKGVGVGFGEGDEAGFGGFGGYFRIVRQRVWSEWTQSAVYGSQEVCIVGMTVLRNGQVTNIKVEKASGNGFYDSVAIRAVRNATPLPPLPSSYGKDEVRVRIQFKMME